MKSLINITCIHVQFIQCQDLTRLVNNDGANHRMFIILTLLHVIIDVHIRFVACAFNALA